MRWPGQLPAGSVCHELAATMDIWPTVAKLAGTSPPTDRIIDGKDIWPLMSRQRGARSPHEAYFYYWGQHLQAVRSGPWKLHLPHSYSTPDSVGNGGKAGKMVTRQTGVALFNLQQDLDETKHLAAQQQTSSSALKPWLKDAVGTWAI